MSARRLLIFGGIALVAAGMLFGDIFAVFILHQNAGGQGAALIAANQAIENAGIAPGKLAEDARQYRTGQETGDLELRT